MRKWGQSLPASVAVQWRTSEEQVSGSSGGVQACTSCGQLINSLDCTASCSMSGPGEASRYPRKLCPDRKSPEAQWNMEHRAKGTARSRFTWKGDTCYGKERFFLFVKLSSVNWALCPQELQPTQAAVTLIQFRSVLLPLWCDACLHMVLKVIFLVLTESQRQGKYLPKAHAFNQPLNGTEVTISHIISR